MPELLTPPEQIDVLRQEFLQKAVEFRDFPSQRVKVLAEIDAVLDMANIIKFRMDWEPEVPYGG
jgi:hypothetical protein